MVQPAQAAFKVWSTQRVQFNFSLVREESVAFDGCLLYISSSRPNGVGGHDIWVARRPM